MSVDNTSPNTSFSKLLFTGLVFHLVFIGSVFDCYFTSPVVHGMQSFRLPDAESKRLVLIVGDGLRADLLFSPNAFPLVKDAPEIVAPYLRSVVETKGAFGVSHTRVPTESRPGHVALIGGMYEDVSAVTKGWKTNPVDFDSVFNQSRHTFSFGSPDILPMFARGATPGKVKTWCYNEEDEDFTKDATALDIWVLDQLRDLFHNASTDSVLDSELRNDKTVFFLHLLGLDTTGHSYRPHSKEYMQNIQVVDDIVHQTEDLFSEFFKDDDTSFIFSADHGMSRIGNHGDGDPDNTRTPLIAWGRGIRPPLPDTIPSSHDSYSRPWNLSHLLRRDVEQADIAPLMASLVGIHWPVNSVGVLPDVNPALPGYLMPRNGEKTLANAALVNAMMILEQYRVKHELKQRHALFYEPFHELETLARPDVTLKADKLLDIERAINDGQWYEARKKADELIKLGLEGLRYLQIYDRFLIGGIVAAAYLGWAAYTSLFVFLPKGGPKPSHSVASSITFSAVGILLVFWTLFAVQKSPWSFYIYISFPCFFWHQTLIESLGSIRCWLGSDRNGYIVYTKGILQGILVIATLQSMVIAYTHRSIWSIGCVLMGVIWPLFSWSNSIRVSNRLLHGLWTLSCLMTGVFPLLAVNKKESLSTIVLGGAALFLIGGSCTFALAHRNQQSRKNSPFFGIQLFLLATTIVITASSVSSLQAKIGLPLLNQTSGWIVLVIASILPFLVPIRHPDVYSKILSLFLGFSPCFVILSISIEGMFYLAYSMNLVLWIEVEYMLRAAKFSLDRKDSSKHGQGLGYQFQGDDMRIALFFLFFVQISFFGTGNVASISSFYLEPVYRLVPIFNPFLMGTLLIFKVVAPYIILSATFATLNTYLLLPPFSLFIVALSLTDVMTLTFFFKVTDTGSWLEIGQSISFFCITSLLLVLSAGICAAGEKLMASTFSARTALKED